MRTLEIVEALSKRLLALPRETFEQGLQSVLAYLGEVTKVQRSYLYLLSPDGSALDTAHEWCSEGTLAHDFNQFRGVPVTAFPWSMQRLLRGETIVVQTPGSLPPEAEAERSACDSLGILSYVNLPLFAGDKMMGWLGFDAVDAPAGWSADELSMMKAAGRMILAALMRWRREEQLFQEHELSRRLAALGSFAAGLAHELNNPLAYMLSNLEILQDQLQRLPGATEELHEAVRDSLSGVHQVAGTVRNLRKLSKPPSPQPSPLNLIDTLALALKVVGPRLALRATLETELPERLFVLGTSVELGQVFMNLLNRAYEALPEGRAAEHFVSLRARTEGPQVVVELEDNGVSVPEDELSRVFEPFRTHRAGFGLAVCHRIIQAHGGQITIERREDRGSVIRVCLERSPRAHQASEALASARLRLLIVDDEPALLRAHKRVFKAHEVKTASSGNEAIALLSENPQFDVILSDIHMPDGDGIDLYRAIQKAHPHLLSRIIFLYGGAFSDRTANFLTAVDAPKFSKPLSNSRLREVVEKAGRRSSHASSEE